MPNIIDTELAKKTLEDFPEPSKGADVKPTLSSKVVNDTFALLLEVEKNGGYGDIAATIGFDKIHKDQVAEIHKKMIARKIELTPVE